MNRKNNNAVFVVIVGIVIAISVVLAVMFALGSAKNHTSPENRYLNGNRAEKIPKKEAVVENNEEEEQQIPETDEPTIEEPVVDEPVDEEPVKEEPIVEEPIVEEEPAEPETPKAEQPELPQPAITDVDGDWNLILANPWNKLPDDFTVQLADIAGGHKVDARIVDDLDAMMKDMAKDGCSAFVCSSYRTNSKQTSLYNNEVADYVAQGYSREDAAVMAAKWVAIPGTSEHQTGLAVDIMSNHYLVLDEGQEDTAEQKWLMANSYKYGFILRYPSNKSELTGINYEPWHYRYVGKEAAKEIYEKDICLEEYLAQ